MCDKALTEMFRGMANVDPLTHKILTNDFEQASQGMESLGKRWNLPLVEEDAKLYQDDPELGMGRAAAIGLSIYGPTAAGGLIGQAGNAAQAVEAAQALGTAQQATEAAQLLQTAQETLGAFGGLDPETLAGMGGMGVSQNGIGPGTLGNQWRGALNNPSSLLSKEGALSNTMKRMVGGGGSGDSQKLMMNMGMNMMQPKEPQMQMPPPRPMQNQQEGPLPTPYNQGVAPGQSSMGLLGKDPSMLSEEEKRRLRMMGVRI